MKAATLSVLFASLALSVASPAFAGGIEPLAFDAKALSPEMKYDGKLDAGVHWKDKNGDNFVIFSRKENQNQSTGETSVYLYVNHYIRTPKGSVKQLRQIKDMFERCEFDNMTAFEKDSIQTTDLDGDGIGEITFGYTVDCTSDISPLAFKLLILENGDKYIIRGTTRIDYGDGTVFGGEKNIDASLKKGPKAFREHAEKQWKKFTEVRY